MLEIIFLFILRFYFYVCVYVCVRVCVHVSTGTHRDQKRVSDPKEVELKAVMSHNVGVFISSSLMV